MLLLAADERQYKDHFTTSGTESYLAAIEASVLRRRRYAALRVLQCQHREVCRVQPVERPAL